MPAKHESRFRKVIKNAAIETLSLAILTWLFFGGISFFLLSMFFIVDVIFAYRHEYTTLCVYAYNHVKDNYLSGNNCQKIKDNSDKRIIAREARLGSAGNYDSSIVINESVQQAYNPHSSAGDCYNKGVNFFANSNEQESINCLHSNEHQVDSSSGWCEYMKEGIRHTQSADERRVNEVQAFEPGQLIKR